VDLAQNPAVKYISLDAVVQDADESPPGLLREDFNFGAVATHGNSTWPSGWSWSQQNWEEIGESDGPVAGDVAITSFMAGTEQGLRLQGAAKGLQGHVNLSYATNATLTFTYRRKDLISAADFVSVQVSADGGATWAELGQWAGPATDDEMQSATYDVSDFLVADFAVRLITSDAFAPDARLYVNFAQIEYGSQFASDEQVYEGALTHQLFLPLVSTSNTSEAITSKETASPTNMRPGFSGVYWRYTADDFTSASYSNNHGNVNWETNWIEDDVAGAGASTGNVNILGGELWLDDNPNTNTQPSLRREITFPTGVAQARLYFEFRTTSGVDTNDGVVVEISSNKGASYAILETFQNIKGTLSAWRDYDIKAFATADTIVRFRVASNYDAASENFVVGYVEAYYTTACSSCVDVSNLNSPHVRTVRADQLWNESPYRQGQGVAVAVVDSGIAWSDDLSDNQWSGRVVAGVNFADEWYVDDLNGHGTHVAGIIGGDGYFSDGKYLGVAPKVNLVDVKVLDDIGRGYLSDVVAGLQWINDNRTYYNIRVANLSLNTISYQSYHESPLNAALEILWFNGVVVVVSAGNNGFLTPGTVYPPANDPFVITVGAIDDKGTSSISDDTISSFSAYGTTPEGFAKPDLVAPGRNVVSLLASEDSNLARLFADYRVADWAGYTYFRMSGTSAAAPMVSGAAALLLQDEPNLTPDQVKYRLTATANKTWSGYLSTKAGAGILDVYAAVKGTTTQSANTGRQASQMLWSGSQPLTWGSVSWNSVSWNSVSWNSVSWNSVSWNSVSWNSYYWGP
jgi:serine protease AprX